MPGKEYACLLRNNSIIAYLENNSLRGGACFRYLAGIIPLDPIVDPEFPAISQNPEKEM